MFVALFASYNICSAYMFLACAIAAALSVGFCLPEVKILDSDVAPETAKVSMRRAAPAALVAAAMTFALVALVGCATSQDAELARYLNGHRRAPRQALVLNEVVIAGDLPKGELAAK